MKKKKKQGSTELKKKELKKVIRAATVFILTRAKKADSQMLEIGRYLLDNIFNGVPPIKGERSMPESYTKICKRVEQSVKRTSLSYAVRVAYQEKELKKSGVNTDDLSFYQQVALLGEKDKNRKVKLAKDAIEDDSTVQEIITEIKDSKSPAAEKTKPIDEVKKAFNNIQQIACSIDKLEKNNVDVDSVLSEMPYQERVDFVRKVTALSEKLLGLNYGCRILKLKCDKTAKDKGELESWKNDILGNRRAVN